jgi:hypothetical protein
VLPEGTRLTGSAALYCVYRRGNAAVVKQLLEPASGWTIGLWALDEPDPSLAEQTVGSGPGTKFELVNRLLEARPRTDEQHVIVADDDARFVRGNVASFLETAVAAELDLAQPAHVWWSNISHRITWKRPLSRARLTTFVEIGPIFAVAPAWREQIVPFPDGLGMGWGLELDWMDMHDEGCSLGIVDATPIRHLARFATAYAPDDEITRLAERLEARGAPGWKGLRRTLATWRPWRRRPPWADQAWSSSRS